MFSLHHYHHFIWSQKYCLALRKKDNLMWKMTEIFTRFSCRCINWDTLRASANTVHSHHDKLVFGERGQASYVIKCCYGSWDLLVVPRGKTRFVIYDIILKVNSCMVVKINSKGQEKINRFLFGARINIFFWLHEFYLFDLHPKNPRVLKGKI